MIQQTGSFNKDMRVLDIIQNFAYPYIFLNHWQDLVEKKISSRFEGFLWPYRRLRVWIAAAMPFKFILAFQVHFENIIAIWDEIVDIEWIKFYAWFLKDMLF